MYFFQIVCIMHVACASIIQATCSCNGRAYQSQAVISMTMQEAIDKR